MLIHPMLKWSLSVCVILGCWPIPAASAQPAQSRQNQTLFQNAMVFDGTSDRLTGPTDVLIDGNLIREIGDDIDAPEGAVVVDVDGRTLMPGMIDCHWHSVMAIVPLAKLLQSDIGYMTIVGSQANRDALMRGFTTLRDVGGNVFAIKQATDEGLIVGPRLYPSGAYISQTSGHGDLRGPNDVPALGCGHLSYLEAVGMTSIADGVPEVIKATRENLRKGATQIKAMAGGGVTSTYDPLDVTEYTFEEMKAIVDVAKTWNTYVCVHAFTPNAVRQCIEAGVMSIEHGHLLDEDTLKLMAEKGVWLSIQPLLDDEDAIPFPEGSGQRKRYLEVTAGTERVIKAARKHGVKVAWGTDTLFDPGLAAKQGKVAAKMARWYKPHEVLRMVTHDNAQLVKMCGPRDPYPGELGVIKEGALADLLIVDGNPIEDINLIADADRNFVLIMKDGKVYKNELE